MQTVKMLPKWDLRSCLGVYLGHSPCHAGSVALVLDPKTLHVSPHFHVVFNHNFTTIPFLATQDVPPNCSQLISLSESATNEDDDLAKQWMDSQENPDKYLTDEEGVFLQCADQEDDQEQHQLALNPEGVNMETMMEPTLPDLNELFRRKLR